MGGEDLGPYGTHYHMGGSPHVSGVEREGGGEGLKKLSHGWVATCEWG